MLVKELIRKLQSVDENLPIRVICTSGPNPDICIEYGDSWNDLNIWVYRDREGDKLNPASAVITIRDRPSLLMEETKTTRGKASVGIPPQGGE